VAFDPTNLATPLLIALYGTWKYVIPALTKRPAGNGGENGVNCRAAGAIGSMSKDDFTEKIAVASAIALKQALEPHNSVLARMAAAQEETNRQMLSLTTRMQVENEFRTRRGG
jgi:hypothetical protein